MYTANAPANPGMAQSYVGWVKRKREESTVAQIHHAPEASVKNQKA